MSNVSTVIVVCEEDDLDMVRARLDAILLAQESRATFKQVDQGFGGDKHPQAHVFGSAINYLQLEEFVRDVLALPWEYPEGLVIVVQPDQGATQVYRPPEASWAHLV